MAMLRYAPGWLGVSLTKHCLSNSLSYAEELYRLLKATAHV
jgi:hypothetical protein